jgi:hypothetical protein
MLCGPATVSLFWHLLLFLERTLASALETGMM